MNEVMPVGDEKLVGRLSVLDVDRAKGGPGLGQRRDECGAGRVWDEWKYGCCMWACRARSDLRATADETVKNQNKQQAQQEPTYALRTSSTAEL